MSHGFRLWQKTWQILNDTALTLAKAGDVEGAAVVLGHLEGHIPSYGMESGLGVRAEPQRGRPAGTPIE